VAIAVEKLTPARWSLIASGLLTAGLVALGVVALARPSWLPGLDGGMSMNGGGDSGADMGGDAGADMGGSMP
jgi:hypothetical protein